MTDTWLAGGPVHVRRWALALVGALAGSVLAASPAHAAVGTVTGIITDGSGNPLANIHVEVSGTDSMHTGVDGAFSLQAEGTYSLCAYDHTGPQTVAATCAGGGNFVGDAATFTMPSGGSQQHDISMPAAATISGRLLAGGTGAQASVHVFYYSASRAQWTPVFWGLRTRGNSAGDYTVGGLPAGTYKVSFGGRRYVQEFYSDKATLAEATPVPTSQGSPATAIDATVVERPSISGTVTGMAGSSSYIDRSVRAVNPTTNKTKGRGYVGSDGSYTIPGLTAGATYRVSFARISGVATKEAQFYNGKAESLGRGAANLVTVGTANTPNVNATLITGGSITGTLLDTAGAPLANCYLHAFVLDGSRVTRGGFSSSTGTFTIGGLSTGQYYVRAMCGSGRQFRVAGSTDMSTDRSAAGLVGVTVGSASPVGTLRYSQLPQVSSTGTPTVTGTFAVNGQLTVNPGAWTPSDTTFDYRWYDYTTDDTLGSGQVLTVPASAAGHRVYVRLTASRSGYRSRTLWVYPTTPVTGTTQPPVVQPPVTQPPVTQPPVTQPPVVPPPVVQPPATIAIGTAKVTGKLKVGKVLKAVAAAITPGTTVKYQWLRSGKKIKKATKAKYKVVKADKGKKLSLRITYAHTGMPSVVKTVKVGKIK